MIVNTKFDCPFCDLLEFYMRVVKSLGSECEQLKDVLLRFLLDRELNNFNRIKILYKC